MKRLVPLWILILVLVAALSGCDAKEPGCSATMADPGSFENLCGLGVSAGARSVSLTMRVSLKSGALDWALEDPQGITRWEGHADAGDSLLQTTTLPRPLPGRWNLKIKLDAAAGEYTAPWVVR